MIRNLLIGLLVAALAGSAGAQTVFTAPAASSGGGAVTAPLGTQSKAASVAITDGGNNLNVTVGNASIAVTGTFFQATQPVSAASLPLPTGAMGSTGGTVQSVPATSGGAGVLCNLALKATATVCDASAGQIYGISINNAQNTVEEDVQLYAVAQGSTVVGTTPVTKCIGVGPGMVYVYAPPLGLAFANAITVAVTQGVSSACTGTTAPTNNVGVSVDGK